MHCTINSCNFSESNLKETVQNDLIQLKHNINIIYAIAFSACGRVLVTAGDKNKIFIWKYTQQNYVLSHTIFLNECQCIQLIFLRDSKAFFSVHQEGIIKLWQSAKPKLIQTIKIDSCQLYALQLSIDGKYLISTTQNSTILVIMISAFLKTTLLTLEDETVQCVALAPDSSTVVVCSKSNYIFWYDIQGQRGKSFTAKIQGHKNQIKDAIFSPDGQLLASCSFDGTCKLWDACNKSNIATFFITSGYVLSLAFSPDGHTLALGTKDSGLQLWDVNSKSQIAYIRQSYFSAVRGLVFTPDAKSLAFVVNSSVYILNSYQKSIFLNTNNIQIGHNSAIKSIVFAPNSTFFVSCSEDSTARLWDIESCSEVQKIICKMGYYKQIAISPDSSVVALACTDSFIYLHSSVNLAIIAILQGHRDEVSTVAFSPDGLILASGGFDNIVHLWDAKQHIKIRNQIVGSDISISKIEFSPDGKVLAFISADNVLRFWNVLREQFIELPQYMITQVYLLAFSPDATSLAYCKNQEQVCVWLIKEQRILHRFTAVGKYVYQIAYSQDGTTLASCATNGDVYLWRTNDLSLIKYITLFKSKLVCIALSRDAQKIVLGSEYGTIWIRDLEREDSGKQQIQRQAVAEYKAEFDRRQGKFLEIFLNYISVKISSALAQSSEEKLYQN